MIYKTQDGRLIDSEKTTFIVYSKEPGGNRRRRIQFVNAESEDEAMVISKCFDFEYAKKIEVKTHEM